MAEIEAKGNQTADSRNSKRARFSHQQHQQHQEEPPPPPRQEKYQPENQHQHIRRRDEEDDLGCFCSNDGCPWHWGAGSGTRSKLESSSSESAVSAAPTSTAGLMGSRSTEGCRRSVGNGEESGSLQPSQLLNGPLLSVREYRDRPTGEVRFAVFQGDRRMSVAQILFSLKHGEDNHSYGHVKSVRVDQDFRGRGLGPLLFKEVFATLETLKVNEIRLEAEEDMGKYNRLVRYYEDLGFRRLEGSKVRYVHHSDQVYRKIPMWRHVAPPVQPRSRRSQRLAGNGWFLLVRLQTKAGCFVRSTADGNVVSPRAPAYNSHGKSVADGRSGGGRCGRAYRCASSTVSLTMTGKTGGSPTFAGVNGNGDSGDSCRGASGRRSDTSMGGGSAPSSCGTGGGGAACLNGDVPEGGESTRIVGAIHGGGGGAVPGTVNGGCTVRVGATTAPAQTESSGEATGRSGSGRRVRRKEPNGQRRSDSDDFWTLMVHDVRGVVCFESAYGKYLCVEPDGKVVADRSWDNSWEQFRLERFADYPGEPQLPGGDPSGKRYAPPRKSETCQASSTSAPISTSESRGGGGGVGLEAQGRGIVKGGGGNGEERIGKKDDACERDNSPGGAALPQFLQPSASSGVSMARDRFALRTFHGQYLSLDAEGGTVSASAHPVMWTTDEKNAICHCEGAIPWVEPPPMSRRQLALQNHLRNMRQVQSVSFVSSVHNKYASSFGRRGRFSIKDVLNLLNRHHDPLQSATVSRTSFAGLMVLTAEDIREEGLPDWMQAIGLVHGLGRILHFLGEDAGVTPTERECVLGEYSWVVGAPFPGSITCPSYNVDNDDALDERYGAGGGNPTGMYEKASGLENALLCFTGPEYMHMVLRNHGTSSIPPQGLAMLRLYPLESWHAGNGYSELESQVDKDLKSAVRQFDAIRRATLHSVTMTRREVNLEQAWNHYLRDLVDKFFPGDLAW